MTTERRTAEPNDAIREARGLFRVLRLRGFDRETAALTAAMRWRYLRPLDPLTERICERIVAA